MFSQVNREPAEKAPRKAQFKKERHEKMIRRATTNLLRLRAGDLVQVVSALSEAFQETVLFVETQLVKIEQNRRSNGILGGFHGLREDPSAFQTSGG
jgi:hypothetical protein